MPVILTLKLATSTWTALIKNELDILNENADHNNLTQNVLNNENHTDSKNSKFFGEDKNSKNSDIFESNNEINELNELNEINENLENVENNSQNSSKNNDTPEIYYKKILNKFPHMSDDEKFLMKVIYSKFVKNEKEDEPIFLILRDDNHEKSVLKVND